MKYVSIIIAATLVFITSCSNPKKENNMEKTG